MVLELQGVSGIVTNVFVLPIIRQKRGLFFFLLTYSPELENTYLRRSKGLLLQTDDTFPVILFLNVIRKFLIQVSKEMNHHIPGTQVHSWAQSSAPWRHRTASRKRVPPPAGRSPSSALAGWLWRPIASASSIRRSPPTDDYQIFI